MGIERVLSDEELKEIKKGDIEYTMPSKIKDRNSANNEVPSSKHELWMPFDNEIGIHDATWEDNLGESRQYEGPKRMNIRGDDLFPRSEEQGIIKH